MRKIYVASSWRNEYQPKVVDMLRFMGHEVYDFRNPPKRSGFAWSDIDQNWMNWTPEQYKEALKHPLSNAGFMSDFDGMKWADTCVMVLPCGRSANTEAGWMKGAGKDVFVFQPIPQEPELMYKIYNDLILSLDELKEKLEIKMAVDESEMTRTFRDLLKDLQQLTDDQLDQPVRALVDDDGSARHLVEMHISDEDIYSDPNLFGDEGSTLDQLKEDYPEEWGTLVKDYHKTPAGTVFVWVDNPYKEIVTNI